MTPDKFSIKFPYLKPNVCRDISIDETLQTIKYSQHCFVLYEPYDQPCELLFTALNKETFIMFLVMLGQYEELYKFLKLLIISHDRLSKQPKKGMALTEMVTDHVNKYWQTYIEEKKEA